MLRNLSETHIKIKVTVMLCIHYIKFNQIMDIFYLIIIKLIFM